MISCTIDTDSNFSFNANGNVHDALNKRHQFSYTTITQLINKLQSQYVVTDLDILSKDPAAHGLVSFTQGYISKEQALSLLHRICNIDAAGKIRLQEEKITIVQSLDLLPLVETRGEHILLDEHFSAESNAFDFRINALSEKLGKEWLSFISIIKTISIVKMKSRVGLPYFSGSTTDYWGAIHMSNPAYESILAESITHESAHFWLALVEDIFELSTYTWENPIYKSPWREDLRPIGGIVHGVFVFACAINALVRLYIVSQSDDDRERISSRICRLIAQVEAGVIELEKSALLTKLGETIIHSSYNNIKFAINLVDKSELTANRKEVTKEQSLK